MEMSLEKTGYEDAKRLQTGELVFSADDVAAEVTYRWEQRYSTAGNLFHVVLSNGEVWQWGPGLLGRRVSTHQHLEPSH